MAIIQLAWWCKKLEEGIWSLAIFAPSIHMPFLNNCIPSALLGINSPNHHVIWLALTPTPSSRGSRQSGFLLFNGVSDLFFPWEACNPFNGLRELFSGTLKKGSFHLSSELGRVPAWDRSAELSSCDGVASLRRISRYTGLPHKGLSH